VQEILVILQEVEVEVVIRRLIIELVVLVEMDK
jgi:hypothetical protein